MRKPTNNQELYEVQMQKCRWTVEAAADRNLVGQARCQDKRPEAKFKVRTAVRCQEGNTKAVIGPTQTN